MKSRLGIWSLVLLLGFELCPLRFAAGATPRFVLAWGQKGVGPGEFRSPIGIAISRRDIILVAEFNSNRVQKFDTRGKRAIYQETIGSISL